MRLGATCLLIALCGAIRGQQFPPATEKHGAFSLPDAAGARLLANPTLPHPDRFHTALCGGGGRFSVRFDRNQAENKDNDGRRTAKNFDKMAGGVFTVLQGKVAPGAVCFLASDALLQAASVLTPEPAAKPGACGAGTSEKLAASRNRGVTNCWQVAALPAGRQLVLAEFARQNKDALASAVLIDGNQTVAADFHAVFRGEGQDLWRADDGGVFSAEGFEVVFLLQHGTAYTLGISWRGTEGVTLLLYDSTGARFTQVIADYWYQAPV